MYRSKYYRRGNIVGCIDAADEPVIFKIREVDGYWVRGVNFLNQKDLIATVPELIPVEITEDILLMCGFRLEQIITGRYFAKFCHFTNGLYDGIDAYTDASWVKITRYNRFVDFFSSLHVFQNTYRSMTGLELEIDF